METIDGGHGQDQAIRIRQLYDDLDVDYVVVDTNGGDAPPSGDSWSAARKKTRSHRQRIRGDLANLANYNPRTSPRHLT